MKGYFYSNKLLIGEIDYANSYQDVKSIGMGGICGDFSPNENYKLVRKEIQDWNDNLFHRNFEFDWSKWYSLNFNVQLKNGYWLLPQGGYEIYDYRNFPDEPLEVRTAGIHSHIFEDYFIQNKPFLNDSWRKISIKEKLLYEKKFINETSLEKRLSLAINNSREPYFYALALHLSTQKVLFSTYWTKTATFSIVDFENKDESGNPTFEFYGSFEEFL